MHYLWPNPTTNETFDNNEFDKAINHLFWYYHFFHVFGYAYMKHFIDSIDDVYSSGFWNFQDFGSFWNLGCNKPDLLKTFHLISQFFFSPLFQLFFSECETMSSHCRRILDFSIKLMTFKIYILKPCILSKHFSFQLNSYVK